MCLSIPGKLVSVDGEIGVVRVGGAERKVGLQLVPKASPGDFVLLHAGFAIQVIDEEEAQITMSLLSEMFEAAEEH